MSSDDEQTEDTVFSRLELDTEDCNVRQDVNIGHLSAGMVPCIGIRRVHIL